MSHRVALINSRVSNLRNIVKALAHLGADFMVTDDPRELASADKIIMPGVGAFSAGMAGLKAKGLDDAIRKCVASGKMFLGICLGMQLLMDKSFEFGENEGLGIVAGAVKRLPADRVWQDGRSRAWPAKVPHVGWDGVRIQKDDKVLGLEKGKIDHFYFTHSFAVYPDDASVVVGSMDSGYGPFCAVLRQDNVVACQFHLELSGARGLELLKGFLAAS